MDQEHTISIVIVSWNTCELLRDCLASTLSSELGATSETIVVDNASGDGSVEMIRREFPRTRLIVNEANLGFAAATNQGIRASHGRYILLLNPDTRATDSFLKILMCFLQRNPKAAAVGPRLHGRRGEFQISCSPLPTVSRELWRLFHLDRFYGLSCYFLRQGDSWLPRQVEALGGACILIRREVLNQVGYLDERFFIYSEELDLCRRILDGGWQIYWVPEAVVVHYGGESTKQMKRRMFLELYRSKVQYFRKHAGHYGALRYKLVLLAAALLRLILSPVLFVFSPSRRQEFGALLQNYSSLLIRLAAL